MIQVVCANGHHTSKRDPSSWRHDRRCANCAEPTVIDYRNRCTHQSWRYPNALPIDGDLCPDCNVEYVEPLRYMSEARLEYLRGIGEWIAVLLEEADGLYDRKEAGAAIRDIRYAHGFTDRYKDGFTE